MNDKREVTDLVQGEESAYTDKLKNVRKFFIIRVMDSDPKFNCQTTYANGNPKTNFTDQGRLKHANQ
jgi:hypothetical protein